MIKRVAKAGAIVRIAKFNLGQAVRHRLFPFRGVIVDVDPVFNNTEEWYQSIPEEVRPSKDQPFYHLMAENDETDYAAYVSEQNLEADHSGKPFIHIDLDEHFIQIAPDRFTLRNSPVH